MRFGNIILLLFFGSWLKPALNGDHDILHVGVRVQTHVTLHRIAFWPFHIQPIHHFSCFSTACKFSFTSGGIPRELPSTTHTWMPWWYVSKSCYFASCCAAQGPASPAQAASWTKITHLKSWRWHSTVARAIPQQGILACVGIQTTSPKEHHY